MAISGIHVPRVRRLVVQPTVLTSLVPLVILFQLASVHCAHVFDAYRLVQYDRGGQPLGSRRATVNNVAVSSAVVNMGPLDTEPPELQEPDDADLDDDDMDDPDAGQRKQQQRARRKRTPSHDDLSRNLVVLDVRQASSALVDRVADYHHAAAILVVLPRDLSVLTDSERAQWREFEQHILNRELLAAVYFAFEDEGLDEVISTLKGQGKKPSATSGDRFQMMVSSSEATVIPTVTVQNFQGWQHSAPSLNADTESQPTIAVVANYDTFAAAPELATGVDHNGSGTIAVLELARIFSRLYSEFRTQGGANLIFVLTGGGRLNFAGIKHWLSNSDDRVLEAIEFAVCLESIGSGNELYLHVSRPAKTPQVKQLYENFRSTAAAMDIPFEVIRRKINVSDPVVHWQHEQFSRKRIVAGTLSSRRDSAPNGGGLLDTKANAAILRRNIRFVAELLCRQIYQTPPAVGNTKGSHGLITGAMAVNEHFVDAWIHFLSVTPRVSPYLDKKSEALTQIEKTLNKYATEVQTTTFALDSQTDQRYRFYTSAAATMSVYKVKPVFFDIFLGLGIAAYLATFAFVVKVVNFGFAEAVASVTSA